MSILPYPPLLSDAGFIELYMVYFLVNLVNPGVLDRFLWWGFWGHRTKSVWSKEKKINMFRNIDFCEV